MLKYTWVWMGQTQKGKCEWRTKEGSVTQGQAWTNTVENDIIERTKATYYATVVAEFVNQCQKQGITATLSSVDVECEIVKDALVRSCYWGGAEHAFELCGLTQAFIVKVKGTVVFESDQKLTGSPILPVLIIVLAKAIALIIIAVGVAYGIYAFLNNLTLNETSSTVTTETIDPNTGVITKKTETATTQAPSMAAWGGIIALAVLVVGAVVVLPKLLEKRTK